MYMPSGRCVIVYIDILFISVLFITKFRPNKAARPLTNKVKL